MTEKWNLYFPGDHTMQSMGASAGAGSLSWQHSFESSLQASSGAAGGAFPHTLTQTLSMDNKSSRDADDVELMSSDSSSSSSSDEWLQLFVYESHMDKCGVPALCMWCVKSSYQAACGLLFGWLFRSLYLFNYRIHSVLYISNTEYDPSGIP